MDDIKDLTLSINMGDIHKFMIEYENLRDFIYSTIWQSFDESERAEPTTNRVITISTELVLLNGILRQYINEKELSTRIDTLNEELEEYKQVKSTKTKRGSDSEYERVFNVLKQL